MSMGNIVAKEDLSKMTKEELIELIISLQNENAELKKNSSKVCFEEISDEKIRSCVKEYIKELPEDAEVFLFDITKKYNIDPVDLERVMDKMQKEGYFR